MVGVFEKKVRRYACSGYLYDGFVRILGRSSGSCIVGLIRWSDCRSWGWLVKRIGQLKMWSTVSGTCLQ